MQEKETTYSLFVAIENEAAQSNLSSLSLHRSISVHPESEEGFLNRTSVLVTINSSRTRYLHQPHHIHAHDNVNLPPPAPLSQPSPLSQPLPPQCVSSSSVLLDLSWTSSIKGFMSNVEPQNLTELVNEDCGGASVPPAVLGAYYPLLHPQDPQQHDVDPPLLSQHGLIMCRALMEQYAEPLIK